MQKLIVGTANWPIQDRLRVYENAYRARLLECMQEEFPVLARTLGDEAFFGLAQEYLRAFPPTDYTLGTLGSRFPRFMAESRPARVGGEQELDQIDCLVDLAHFEWQINEVFDGPGTESQPRDIESLSVSIDGRDAFQLHFHWAPCLRLCAYRFPIRDYHMQIKANEKAAWPRPTPSYVAITRQDYVVVHYALDRVEFELLQLLLERRSLGDAIADVCGRDALHEKIVAQYIRDWFAAWTKRGFILGVI